MNKLVLVVLLAVAAVALAQRGGLRACRTACQASNDAFCIKKCLSQFTPKVRTTKRERAPCGPCLDVYEPVCTRSGRKFPNSCEAKCAGVEGRQLVECAAESDDVEADLAPVLFAKTFLKFFKPRPAYDDVESDRSLAMPRRGSKRTNAPCGPCAEIWEPVCTRSGRQFPNKCEAKCAGVSERSLVECSAQSDVLAPATQDCICPRIYQPVCTADGRRFSNRCQAKCEGVTRSQLRSCPAENDDVEADFKPLRNRCICPRVYKPVCTADGRRFSNGCAASCQGIRSEDLSPCATKPVARPILKKPEEKSCICPAVFDPVCTAEGKQFSNPCHAACQGAQATRGNCESARNTPKSDECVCPAIFEPVCTASGQTFGNVCEAKCAGVTTATEENCWTETK